MVFDILIYLHFIFVSEKSNKVDYSDEELIFDNIWNLVIGRKYLVRAVLYDYLHNQITITENFQFKVEIIYFLCFKIYIY